MDGYVGYVSWGDKPLDFIENVKYTKGHRGVQCSLFQLNAVPKNRPSANFLLIETAERRDISKFSMKQQETQKVQKALCHKGFSAFKETSVYSGFK